MTKNQPAVSLQWMAEMLEAYIVHHGPMHDDDCPGDDTCECSAKPVHDGINAAVRYLQAEARSLSEPQDHSALARAIARTIRGCTSGDAVVEAIEAALCAFPAVPERIKMLAGAAEDMTLIRAVKRPEARSLSERSRHEIQEDVLQAIERDIHQNLYTNTKGGNRAAMFNVVKRVRRQLQERAAPADAPPPQQQEQDTEPA